MTIEKLNELFGNTDTIQFYNGKGNLKSLTVKNKNAQATISLYGGQILSFIPNQQADLLWMSAASIFEKGKAIRGGIPICFPWFGPHLTDTTKPQHGFARLQEWEVATINLIDDGTTLVTLILKESTASLQLWPYKFIATLSFTIGKSLDVTLTIKNSDENKFEYSDALHTYFNISNIDLIEVGGLQDAGFYEGFDLNLKTQNSKNIKFTGETNRRYIHTKSNCFIQDDGFNRKIKVSKSGSRVTIVWNPGAIISKSISDMDPSGYKNFICIEPANAYPGIDMIVLEPGESYSLSTCIEII